MLTELCQEIRNWFVHEVHTGEFTIENGNINADFLQNGQYFRVIGSVFNDGVYMYPTFCLHDETFDGAIWALAIPAPILRLDEEIEAWRKKYEDAESAAMSPFVSESFGGYSYSKGGTGSTNNGNAISWQTAFAARLNKWRKL